MDLKLDHLASLVPKGVVDGGFKYITKSPTFGQNGLVLSEFAASSEPSSDTGNSVRVLPDGKVLLAGMAFGEGGSAVSIVRLNTNGSVDESFGVKGRVTERPGDTVVYQTIQIATMTDGRIIGAVSVDVDGVSRVFVFRYTANGARDTSFGDGGEVILEYSRGFSVKSVEVNGDGKILMAGASFIGNSWSPTTNSMNSLLIQLNINGSKDSGFGTNGFLDVDESSVTRDDQFNQAIFLQDGRIVAVGSVSMPTYETLNMKLYDGIFWSNYQHSGNASSSSAAYSVKQQSDGFILVAGSFRSGGFKRAGVMRFDLDLLYDANFGVNGVVLGLGENYESLCIAPDESFVVVGKMVSMRGDQISRYESDGTFDADFGGTGQLSFPFYKGDFKGRSCAFNAAGSFFVAGPIGPSGSLEEMSTDNIDMGILKYSAAGSFDLSFGDEGGVGIDIGYPVDGMGFRVTKTLQQEDGKILTLLISTNIGQYIGGVARYLANGEIDLDFGAAGLSTYAVPDVGVHVFDMVLQADNKIVVLGAEEGVPFLWRLQSNGIIDATFANGGILMLPEDDTIQVVGLQVLGNRIYTVGMKFDDESQNAQAIITAWQLNGQPDTSFASAGTFKTAFSGEGMFVSSLFKTSDGKLIATGFAAPEDGEIEGTTFRLLANGTLDQSYGAQGYGKFVLSEEDFDDQPLYVQDSGGAIYMIGSEFGGTVAMRRMLSTGIADAEFGLRRVGGEDEELWLMSAAAAPNGGVAFYAAREGEDHPLLYSYDSKGVAAAVQSLAEIDPQSVNLEEVTLSLGRDGALYFAGGTEAGLFILRK